jgi:glutaredoxin
MGLVSRSKIFVLPNVILTMLVFVLSASAQIQVPVMDVAPDTPPADTNKIVLYFFWGEGCPHCAKAKPFLETLRQRYPALEVRSYEVWHNADNMALFAKVAKAYNITASGVPTIFIGDEVVVGYESDATTGKRIEMLVKQCMVFGCVDPGVKAGIVEPTPAPTVRPTVPPQKKQLILDVNVPATLASVEETKALFRRLGLGFDYSEQELVSIAQYIKIYRNLKVYSYEDNNAMRFESVITIVVENNARYPLKNIRLLERVPDDVALQSDIELVLPEYYSATFLATGQGLIAFSLNRLDVGKQVLFSYVVKKRLSQAELSKLPSPAVLAEPAELIQLPFLGTVNPREMSLLTLTLLLGLLDGFNACAMFVLLVLLGILLKLQSRKRMAIVAGTFVFFSGLMYFLFMTVWLHFFEFIGTIGWAFWVIGLIAIVLGVINIKDFFFFGKGPSLVIPESKKPGLYRRMRQIVYAERFWLMLGAAIVLAVTVNFVEFMCTFGFPMVYTKILAEQALPIYVKYLYLVLYQIMYMLDDTIMVIIAVVTLSTKKVGERYGRAIKLITGVLMLGLGIIMLFKPELLMFA